MPTETAVRKANTLDARGAELWRAHALDVSCLYEGAHLIRLLVEERDALRAALGESPR